MAEVQGTTADKVRWRNEDRASTKAIAEGSGASSDYMKSVGKAGIKVQQGHMRAVADDSQADINAAHAAARSARRSKTSAEYKGVK